MISKTALCEILETKSGLSVKRIKALGKGSSGVAFLIETYDEPYKAVVKVSKHSATLKKEKEMLDFLYRKVSLNVPKVYFFFECEDFSLLGMQYIKGISGKSRLIPLVPNKNRLAESILDALDSIQSVKNDKFGKFSSPVYDTWKEYYLDFFNEIYSFTENKHRCGEISQNVMKAMSKIKDSFDFVFDGTVSEACLCHGDFWMPNFIIDFYKSELKGVLDPFDMLWAEPEYELFALTVGYGKGLHLYERYKLRHAVSKHCDLKIEIYALVNELHWFSVLGSVSSSYLEFRAKRILDKIKAHTD